MNFAQVFETVNHAKSRPAIDFQAAQAFLMSPLNFDIPPDAALSWSTRTSASIEGTEVTKTYTRTYKMSNGTTTVEELSETKDCVLHQPGFAYPADQDSVYLVGEMSEGTQETELAELLGNFEHEERDTVN